MLLTPPARAATTRGGAADGYWLQRGDWWFCTRFPRKARAVYVAGEEIRAVVAADAGAANILVA